MGCPQPHRIQQPHGKLQLYGVPPTPWEAPVLWNLPATWDVPSPIGYPSPMESSSSMERPQPHGNSSPMGRPSSMGCPQPHGNSSSTGCPQPHLEVLELHDVRVTDGLEDLDLSEQVLHRGPVEAPLAHTLDSHHLARVPLPGGERRAPWSNPTPSPPLLVGPEGGEPAGRSARRSLTLPYALYTVA